jgi:hypothetical protein
MYIAGYSTDLTLHLSGIALTRSHVNGTTECFRRWTVEAAEAATIEHGWGGYND